MTKKYCYQCEHWDGDGKHYYGFCVKNKFRIWGTYGEPSGVDRPCWEIRKQLELWEWEDK